MTDDKVKEIYQEWCEAIKHLTEAKLDITEAKAKAEKIDSEYREKLKSVI